MTILNQLLLSKLKYFKSTTTQHIISKLKSLKPTNQLLLSNMKSFK